MDAAEASRPEAELVQLVRGLDVMGEPSQDQFVVWSRGIECEGMLGVGC